MLSPEVVPAHLMLVLALALADFVQDLFKRLFRFSLIGCLKSAKVSVSKLLLNPLMSWSWRARPPITSSQ